MIICLSSAHRPRYKQDVLRSLILPIGATLQFRYDYSLVSVDVQAMIEHRSVVGQEVIIAYANQSNNTVDKKVDIELVPTRRAKVISAARTGTTLSIVFLFDTFIYASDLKTFNSEIRGLSKDVLPLWDGVKIQGMFCGQIISLPSMIIDGADLSIWEKIVTQLADYPDFRMEETFFTVLGLFKEKEIINTSTNLKHISWNDQIPAKSNRTLLIYHFHPTKSPTNTFLTIKSGELIKIDSPLKIKLDSRYDLKRINLKIGTPNSASSTWISLSVEGTGLTDLFETDVAIKISGDWLSRMILTIVIAFGLTGSQIIPLMSRIDIDVHNKIMTSLLIFMFSMVVGIATAWRIPRDS